MKILYAVLLVVFYNYGYSIERGEFILKSGHYIKGGPLGVDSNNVGSILLEDGIQKIPTRLLTKMGLKHFEYLSYKNKDFVVSKTEGTKGYIFKELTSFFALNQQKSKANQPIFVYVNPDAKATNKLTSFIKANKGFSAAASFFDKFVFVPKKTEEFQLLKQVMKVEFPSGVILNKNKANEVHSNIKTVEDVINLFTTMKSEQSVAPTGSTTK